MKKFLFKTLSVTMVMMMLVCTTAFAAAISTSVTGNTLTVTVTGLTAGEESTLLAVDAQTVLSTVASNTDAIFYVDQVTATDGTATYSFDITDAGDIDIYSGYSTMAADANPLKASVTQEGDADADSDSDSDADADYTYGDVNNDKAVDGIDAGAIIAHFLNGADFIDSTTNAVYVNGTKAADVNADDAVDGIDAGAVIAKFLNGSPLPVESTTAE